MKLYWWPNLPILVSLSVEVFNILKCVWLSRSRSSINSDRLFSESRDATYSMRKHYTIVQYQGLKNFTLVVHLVKIPCISIFVIFYNSWCRTFWSWQQSKTGRPKLLFFTACCRINGSDFMVILWFFCYGQYRSTNHIYICLLKDGFKMVTKGHCLVVYFYQCSVQLCQNSKLFGISEFPHFITTSQSCFSYFVLD